MTIHLSKFGSVLSSRPAGREAYLATKAYLVKSTDERIEVDFSGVKVLAPSWADEFFRPLYDEYRDKLILLPSDNPSVAASLAMIKGEVPS